MNKTKKAKSKFAWVGNFLVILIYIAIVALGIGFVAYPTISLEHYLRVYQNPTTVIATVSLHDEYEDEGDTDYRSYVTYAVDGTYYKGIRYENKNKESDLSPIGTKVMLEVSPEDPSTLLSDLKQKGVFFYFSIPFASAIIAGTWKMILELKKSDYLSYTPDNQTIKKDARLAILERFNLTFWVLLSIGFALVYWRYSEALWQKIWIIAVVCAVLWIWFLINSIRDLNIINHDAYELRHDVLIDKKIVSDDDGNSYILSYNSSSGVWDTSTDESYYNCAQKGDFVLSVFLPGKKKPLLHYDTLGNAR